MNTLFKALNDVTRRQILDLLRQGSLTAGEIAEVCSVSKPTISHHLDLLKQAELIDEERAGQFRRYHLNTSVVEEVMIWLSGLLARDPAAKSKAPETKTTPKLKPKTR